MIVKPQVNAQYIDGSDLGKVIKPLSYLSIYSKSLWRPTNVPTAS